MIPVLNTSPHPSLTNIDIDNIQQYLGEAPPSNFLGFFANWIPGSRTERMLPPDPDGQNHWFLHFRALIWRVNIRQAVGTHHAPPVTAVKAHCVHCLIYVWPAQVLTLALSLPKISVILSPRNVANVLSGYTYIRQLPFLPCNELLTNVYYGYILHMYNNYTLFFPISERNSG